MDIKVLLVEDEPTLSDLVKEFLEAEGYTVTVGGDGMVAWEAFNEIEPDICILDIMLPLMDGVELLTKIRRANPQVPVIMLTAKALQDDINNGLRLGADDYITKPFNFQELSLRILRLLRRTCPKSEIYTLGKLRFDTIAQKLGEGDNWRQLTAMECQILQMFCENLNHTLSRERMLKHLWGNKDFYNFRSLDVFVSTLRKYLASEPLIKIISIRGVGYRMILKG